MPNLSEPEFQQAVQSLKDERSQLLTDPRVAEKYNTRASAVRRAEREKLDLAHEDYVSKNTSALETAIKNNDTAGVQAFVTGAGPAYADDAQKYVNLITGNIETMQRLEENAIANTQTPNIKMYRDQISQFENPKVKALIQPVLEEYEKTIESGWDEENQQWTTNGRKKAEQLEKRLNALISGVGMNDLSSQMANERARARTLDTQIDQQEAVLDLQVPNEAMMTSARLMAATLYSGRKDGRGRSAPAKPPTEEEIKIIADQLLADAKRNAKVRLTELNKERFPNAEQPEPEPELEPIEDDGGFSVKNSDGQTITRKYALDAKRQGISPKKLAEASNISVEQAKALIGE